MGRQVFTVDDTTKLPPDGVMDAVQAAVIAATRSVYAPTARPAAAAAAGAQAFFDPSRLAYNFKPANTRRLRSGLGKVKGGIGTLRIGMLGDSTTAGYPSDNRKAAPLVMRDLLEAQGYAVQGTGPVVANPGGGPGGYVDPRYSTTGAWTTQANNPNHIRQTTVVGATITFASDRPGTVVEFSYLDLGAGFRYSVDGGTAVVVAASAGTGSLASKQVTGLSDSPHTITITVDSIPNGGGFYLSWVDVRRTTAGILLGNFGVNSSATDTWSTDTFYYPRATLKSWSPDVVFLDLGINDWGSGTTPNNTPADFKARTQALIDFYKGGADIILVTSNPFDGKDYLPYNRVKYELADSNNLPLIDIYEMFESYAISNPLGLYADSAHPSLAGYAEKGAVLARAIAA